jgi:hypothetical protein
MAVCMGAAYVAARERTIEQVMRDGAAFGVQRGHDAGYGKLLFPLVQNGRSGSTSICLKEPTRLKIICDPAFWRPDHTPATRDLRPARGYDFFAFEDEEDGSDFEHAAGEYIFEMRLDCEARMVFITRKPFREGDGRDSAVNSEWKVPVFVDPGQGVMMVDRDRGSA